MKDMGPYPRLCRQLALPTRSGAATHCHPQPVETACLEARLQEAGASEPELKGTGVPQGTGVPPKACTRARERGLSMKNLSLSANYTTSLLAGMRLAAQCSRTHFANDRATSFDSLHSRS